MVLVLKCQMMVNWCWRHNENGADEYPYKSRCERKHYPLKHEEFTFLRFSESRIADAYLYNIHPQLLFLLMLLFSAEIMHLYEFAVAQ
jgi:hypothetical protein